MIFSLSIYACKCHTDYEKYEAGDPHPMRGGSGGRDKHSLIKETFFVNNV